MAPSHIAKAIHFGTFTVTNQVFHSTAHSFALVNIKPLLPGHSLVCPLRVVPRLADLSPDEVGDLFRAVQRVAKMLQRVFASDAFNIAVQDGPAAGQSVPHVHVHVIPRHRRDLDHRGPDAIHAMLDGDEGDVGGALQATALAKSGPFPEESERKPRTVEEMDREAAWFREEMDKAD